MDRADENRVNSLMSGVDFTASRFPKVVRIEPASACNLRCIHCPTGRKSGNRGVMSQATFQVVLRNLEELAPRVVVMYHGGEPFLCQHIFEWIRIIKSMGVGVIKTVTNGTLLTDPMLRKIIESGLDSIEFSLDGQSPEENNRIRIGSDYQKVVNIIKSLIRIKKEMSSKRPTIFIANTQFVGPEMSISTDKADTPQFLLEEFSGVYEGHIAFKNTFAILWPGWVGVKEGEITKVAGTTMLPSFGDYCPHTLETMTIRWNGDVVACCYDITSKYVLGNIKQSKLSEIWNNGKYRRLRTSLHTRKYLPLCENCHVIKPRLSLGWRT